MPNEDPTSPGVGNEPSESDDDCVAANRELWNAWADLHVTSAFYDVEGFKAGRDTLDTVAARDLGDVRGRRLLHLQCHFGLDTMSWARRGASVVGVDFSENAIVHARALASELGLDARFVCSEVASALEHLEPGTFDFVFTSYGAISWLPDLRPWARTIVGALKPGGTFFVADHHPTVWIFDDYATEPSAVYRYSYFDRQPVRDEEHGSYAAPDADYVGVAYGWQHTFEDIIGALLEVGLAITSLREYPYLAFQWFPFMVQGEDSYWRMPEGAPDIPLMFSLTATKPS
jgi:SAM-dependent methyltransferase